MNHPEPLNRQQLLQQMAQRVDGLTQKTAAAAIEAAIEVMSEALGRGRAVKLSGFGSFQVRRRAARTNIHPRTGKPVAVPAAWNVIFTPAQSLRERLQSLALPESRL
ncbi:HU family DNA-binding protein [Gloeobacter kilaueensis]|uniref:Histone family protein DNA-binding protein n=1 Tax=Gloeobacter kilaueensis (strain ATCC BAA-2537 / CCAP 1431/1 / ULC 316 / JS1) TaxID=1183438 RepID=U5QKY0_GLOK1|nr:HU family DNA-binding protein [Gloeobacter kilaueensis]AGY59533.1 histone family protein DNA-binding protein [Gloeobacter kilaueensis JS1]